MNLKICKTKCIHSSITDRKIRLNLKNRFITPPTSARTILSIIVNNVSSNLQLWTPSNHSLRCSFASRSETSRLLYVFSAAKFWKGNIYLIVYARNINYNPLQTMFEKKKKMTYNDIKLWIDVHQLPLGVDNRQRRNSPLYEFFQR